VLELADLIALGQIGVEVVLAVKARVIVDVPVDAEPGLHRLLHAMLIQHRQHAWKGRIDEGDVRIRLLPKRRRRPGKQLGIGDDLGMNLQPDHHLPLACFALQALGCF
jgi:hypothetical protein